METTNLFISLLIFVIAFLGLMQIQKYLNIYIIGLSKLIFNDIYPAKFFYSIVFFPGVVIHEISHLLTAMILGVRTGDVSLLPTIKDKYFRLGSVKVAKSDIFRSTIIGASPLIIGTTIIFFLINKSILPNFAELKVDQSDSLFSIANLLSIYLIITISNTMMLSKSDKKNFLPVMLIIILITTFIKMLFKDSFIISAVIKNIISVFTIISLVFYFTFFLNFFAFIFLFIGVKIAEKIKSKKLLVI